VLAFCVAAKIRYRSSGQQNRCAAFSSADGGFTVTRRQPGSVSWAGWRRAGR